MLKLHLYGRFLPPNVHRKPNKVLIISGGDGAVARECLKCQLVVKFVQIEIRVIKISEEHFPSVAMDYAVIQHTSRRIVGVYYKYLESLPDDDAATQADQHIT